MLAGGAAIVAITAGQAASQPTFQNGPGGGRRVNVEMTARAEYDNNIARGNDVVAQAGGLSRGGDYTYSPAVVLDISLPVGRQSVFLEGSAGYRFYQHNTNLNSQRVDLRGGVNGSLGRCAGGFVGGYGRRQSDLEDLELGTTKNVQTVTSESFNVACSTGAGLGQSFNVTHSQQSGSARTTTDSERWDFGGALAYSNGALGSISLVGAYSEVSYQGTPTGVVDVSNGYNMYSAGVRYERPFGARLNGSVGAQYYRVKTNGAPGSDSGLTANAGLTYRASPRLGLELGYQRSVSPSVRSGADYTVDDSVQLDAHYTFSSRTAVRLGARQVVRDWKGAETPTIQAVRHERRRSVMAGLTFNIGQHATLAADVRREHRSADISLFDYTATRYGITASARF